MNDYKNVHYTDSQHYLAQYIGIDDMDDVKNSHWTSSNILAFIGIGRVICRAVHVMVALWCPRNTLR